MVFNSGLKHWSFFLTSASPRMTTVLLNTVPFREDTKQKQGREGPPLQTSQLQVSKWSLSVPHKANRWLDMWQVQGLLTGSHPTWGSPTAKELQTEVHYSKTILELNFGFISLNLIIMKRQSSAMYSRPAWNSLCSPCWTWTHKSLASISSV